MSTKSLGINPANKFSWAFVPPLLADSSRRIPVRIAVNPKRLALLGKSHLEHYSALGILSLTTQCAHGFYTPSVDGFQTWLFKFRYMLAVNKFKLY